VDGYRVRTPAKVARLNMTFIGIDVGWSEKRPSCGLALSNEKLPLPGGKRTLYVDGGRLRAACFKLNELINVLRCWSVEIQTNWWMPLS